jgi:hypothetical protein
VKNLSIKFLHQPWLKKRGKKMKVTNIKYQLADTAIQICKELGRCKESSDETNFLLKEKTEHETKTYVSALRGQAKYPGMSGTVSVIASIAAAVLTKENQPWWNAGLDATAKFVSPGMEKTFSQYAQGTNAELSARLQVLKNDSEKEFQTASTVDQMVRDTLTNIRESIRSQQTA